MHLSDFDYDLPPELIAQTPADRRDAARLLVVDRASGGITHRVFADLPSLIDDQDLVVLNETRVIPARLIAKKPSGGKVELLLVRRLDVEGGAERWECMARGSGRLGGVVVSFPGGERASFVGEEGEGHYHVDFESAGALEAILQKYGRTPLPPYIKRPSGPEDADPARYQTVYARLPGSCAAPTAGLHFTPTLLDEVASRTAGIARLTLHVGPGTFLPIRQDDIEAHRMHAEWFEVGADAAAAINAAKAGGGRVVAIGTTVVRTLEHVAAGDQTIAAGSGLTRIFIRPGHHFRAVDRLVTNFHLPQSTLLMLVCAFAGRDLVLAAYREAIRERYRFYSYGDAMLIL